MLWLKHSFGWMVFKSHFECCYWNSWLIWEVWLEISLIWHSTILFINTVHMAETYRRPLWKDIATSSARRFGCTNERCSFHGESLILIGCFALEKTMMQFRNERHGKYFKDPSIAVSLLLDNSSFYCWLVFHWILRCFHGDFLIFIGCFVSWTNSLLLRADILCLRLLHYANVVLLAWHLWMQLFIYWLLNYGSMWSYILYLSLARSPARGFSCPCGLSLFIWFFLSMWFSLGLQVCCFSRLSGLMFLSTLCLVWCFSRFSGLALLLVLHSASIILISVRVQVLPLYAPSGTSRTCPFITSVIPIGWLHFIFCL